MGISLYSRQLLVVMTSESYHTAYRLIPPLCLGITIGSITMIYSTVITAQSKTKINGTINVFCAIASVGLNVLLLPRLGLMAAIIVNFLVFFIKYLFFRLLSQLHVNTLYCLIPFIIYVVVSAIFVYLVNFSFMYDILIKTGIFILFVLFVMKVMNIKLNSLVDIIPILRIRKSKQ